MPRGLWQSHVSVDRPHNRRPTSRGSSWSVAERRVELALALEFGAGCGAAEFRVAVHGVHLDARVTWGALRKRKVAVGEAR